MSRAQERMSHHSGVRTRYAKAKTARADGRVGSESPRVVPVLVVVTVRFQQTKKIIARCMHTASYAARVANAKHQERQIRTEATREESAICSRPKGVFKPSPCILHHRERLFLCSQAGKTDMATTNRRGLVMMSVVMDAEEGTRESLGGMVVVVVVVVGK
jgi:hypothetical protein